ncbi:MAG: glutamine--fructose-6-phosphate transaminase (isomerizing) [Vicinamibacteria bacterium]|nr:glutamine--fructose-6-phosphate transaminase (isomerizing) [Vicinamibacteria bacterium]
MCGIVGYVGPRNAVSVIIGGLKRLEYRGYDSAGIAVVRDGRLMRRRTAGKLRHLEDSLRVDPIEGVFGIGHTRWATHGRPSEENAHPHQDCTGRIVVVHNGIIENYLDLKRLLLERNHRIETQTDTEVIAHLVEEQYQGSLLESVRNTLPKLKGVYALALLHVGEPQRLIAARMGPPMVVGLGDHENFLASDIPALLPYTKDFIFLDDGELAEITPDSARLFDRHGHETTRTPQRIAWDPIQVEKGGYRHFMLKEIHEQPQAARDTLVGRIDLEAGDVNLEELGPAIEGLRTAERVVIVACGTSWHAALVGKFLLERLAKIPTETDYGSEFRYREPLVGPSTLAIAISQSGETADTLAAFREAKARGALPVAVCNVRGSMLTREAAGTLLTHAGPEIGVASTKAFTSQIIAMLLIALHAARLRGTLERNTLRALLAGLTRIPSLMDQTLGLDNRIDALSRTLAHAKDFLFIGRGIHYPIALEGALKLKEISYAHAEGYPAGEMKHGPIALIDESVPVVALCPAGRVFEKMVSNVQEVKARGGRVIALVTAGDSTLASVLDGTDDAIIEIPPSEELLSPLLFVVPQQLLAYHVALRAGRDVDQPRNLAKSVTVE